MSDTTTAAVAPAPTTGTSTTSNETENELLCNESLRLLSENPAWSYAQVIRELTRLLPSVAFTKKTLSMQRNYFKTHCLKPLAAKGTLPPRVKAMPLRKESTKQFSGVEASDEDVLACLDAVFAAHAKHLGDLGVALLDENGRARGSLGRFEAWRTVPIALDTFKRRLGRILGAMPRQSHRYQECMTMVELLGGPWATRGNCWTWAENALRTPAPSLVDELDDDAKAARLLEELLGTDANTMEMDQAATIMTDL